MAEDELAKRFQYRGGAVSQEKWIIYGPLLKYEIFQLCQNRLRHHPGQDVKILCPVGPFPGLVLSKI